MLFPFEFCYIAVSVSGVLLLIIQNVLCVHLLSNERPDTTKQGSAFFLIDCNKDGLGGKGEW